MGITVNPSFVPPAPPEEVTSPDGLLSATTDVAHAGVLLVADYAGTPEQVLRTNYATNPGMRATDGTVTVAENLLTDPSVEYGMGGLSTSSDWSAVLDTTRAHSGSQSIRLTATTTSPGSPTNFIFSGTLKPSTAYTFSGWVYAPFGTDPRFLRLGGTAVTAVSGDSTAVRDDWARLTVTGTTTPTAAGSLFLYLFGSDDPAKPVWFDDFTFAEGASTIDDFNGDTPADDTFTYSWTGIAGASMSVKTAQRVAGWDDSVWATAGGGFMSADSATLTVSAPDGTDVKVASSTGPLVATVSGGQAAVTADVGTVLSSVMVGTGDYFDGGDQGTNPAYRWTGAVDASTSQEYVPSTAPAVLPQKVRFYRGDGTLVRSGDPAWAPGGLAVAYDHEAPVGVAASYYAVPLDRDGNPGEATDTLTILIPTRHQPRELWLKSPTRPALSALAWVENPPEISWKARTTVQDIHGSRLPAASWDVRSSAEMTLTIVTETIAEAHVLQALLDAGPLLVQTLPSYDLPDFYCLPGDVTRTRIARMGNPVSRWDVPLTECRRPATLDAPLRIPGNSYAETDPDWPTYAEAIATGTTYAEETSSAAS